MRIASFLSDVRCRSVDFDPTPAPRLILFKCPLNFAISLYQKQLQLQKRAAAPVPELITQNLLPPRGIFPVLVIALPGRKKERKKGAGSAIAQLCIDIGSSVKRRRGHSADHHAAFVF